MSLGEPPATGVPGGCCLQISAAARHCGRISVLEGRHKIGTSDVASGVTDTFHFEDLEKVLMRF